MKFSTTLVLALFGIAAHGLALPTLLSKKADSPVISLEGTVNQLKLSISNDLATITGLVSASPSDATARAAVIANINLALGDIASQISAAANSVVVSTTNADADLDPVDFASFIGYLSQLQTILSNLQTSVQDELATLPTDSISSFGQQLDAIQAAIPTLINPLQAYAQEVNTAISSSGGDVTGLQNVVNSLLNVVTSLLSSLGLTDSSGDLLSGVTGAAGGLVGDLTKTIGNIAGATGLTNLLDALAGATSTGVSGSVNAGANAGLFGKGGLLGTGLHVDIGR